MIEPILNSLYTYVNVPNTMLCGMNTKPGSVGAKVLLPYECLPLDTHYLQR